MNSKQSRGKWADNYTQLAIPHQPSPCHTFNTRSLGCVCVWWGGARRSRLLHQSLAPPAAFPSSPTASNSLHWSPLCFPPSRRPRSLCRGLPREAEPACDIVCHWRITALARCHEHAEDTEEVTSSARVPFCHGLRSRRRAKQLNAGEKQTNN